MKNLLNARALTKKDIPFIVDYWLDSEGAFLKGMGVDLNKIPSKEQLHAFLVTQIEAPLSEKESFCTIWELNNDAIGHCNINQIKWNQEANMHLHIWNSSERRKGTGIAMLKLSLPIFFQNFGLKKIICEPYRFNPAPNRTLEKLGFTFIKSYRTTPGSLNFEQEVNRWELNLNEFKELTRGIK